METTITLHDLIRFAEKMINFDVELGVVIKHNKTETVILVKHKDIDIRPPRNRNGLDRKSIVSDDNTLSEVTESRPSANAKDNTSDRK